MQGLARNIHFGGFGFLHSTGQGDRMVRFQWLSESGDCGSILPPRLPCETGALRYIEW
jgi:hypothetical protein